MGNQNMRMSMCLDDLGHTCNVKRMWCLMRCGKIPFDATTLYHQLEVTVSSRGQLFIASWETKCQHSICRWYFGQCNGVRKTSRTGCHERFHCTSSNFAIGIDLASILEPFLKLSYKQTNICIVFQKCVFQMLNIN